MNIVVVANKWWEMAPLAAVMQHSRPQQQKFSAVPVELRDVRSLAPGDASQPTPRLLAQCNEVNIEVWCVQDLMDPAENSSSTWEKARVLPRIIRDANRESVVIAFGTAACPAGGQKNGNVAIGTSVFLHDPYSTPPNPDKHWSHPRLNQLVLSDAQGVFDKLPRAFVNEAERRLIGPPNDAAIPPKIHIDAASVALGVVNVTNNADYEWTDKQAIKKFTELTGLTSPESLETTHGVIRLVLNRPFLYVSGIANAVGLHREHVGQNPYAQNVVAAHNAAVALAWLLPELASA